MDKCGITIKYVVKRVFFGYFLYSFGAKMASFVQFLANFGTKTYKNCTKNGIFLLYLWINVVLLRICVALLCIKRRFLCVLMLLLDIYLISFLMIWYAYLHKLPPLVYTIYILYGLKRFHYVWNKGLCPFSCQNLSNYTKISPLMEKRLLLENYGWILSHGTKNIHVGTGKDPPPIYIIFILICQ